MQVAISKQTAAGGEKQPFWDYQQGMKQKIVAKTYFNWCKNTYLIVFVFQVARGEVALRIVQPVLTANQSGWCGGPNGAAAKLPVRDQEAESIPPHMYT